MFRKMVSLLLSLLLAVAIFSGCNSGKNTANTETTAKEQNQSTTAESTEKVEKEVTLSYWTYPWWNGIKGDEKDGQPEDWHKWVIEQFTQQNPNIKVKLEMIPWNGGADKMNVAFASKTQPDLLIDSANRLLNYAARGLAVAIDDFYTNEEISDFVEGGWDAGKYAPDGKHYFVPWGFANTYLMVNKTLFDKAGASDLLPENELGTWTFDEFKAALKAVSKNGVYGYGLYAGNEQGDSQNFAFLWGYGARTFSSDLSKITLNSPEGVAGLEFLVSLINEKLVAPGAETLKVTDTIELFKQKKLAICFGTPGYEDAINADVKNGKIAGPFEITRAMFPNVPGKNPVGASNSCGVMVFKSGDSDKEAAAVKLAKYFGSTDIVKTIAPGGVLPYLKSAGDISNGNAGLKYTADTLKFMIDPGFAKIGYAELRAAFYPELQAAFTKTKTAQEALDSFVQIASDKIKKAEEKK